MNTYEFDVIRQVEKLQTASLHEIELMVASKRAMWVEGVRGRFGRQPPTPRQAYELFFEEYLGLDLDTVPVALESDDRIVWRSVNPCPTLEACIQLRMDTQKVCRKAYDKSTQAFFSALDPELRFHRSYHKIRPVEPFCEEWIVRVDFESWMQVAIAEAKQSRATGNKGYGAVVAFDGRIIAQAHDTASGEGDPSLHAEVNAIRQACRILGDSDLSGAVLISTCEPCPMCSSLVVWANLTTIVFGASIEETRALGKSRIAISAREIIEKSPALVEVLEGVLRDECLSLYE